MGFAEDPLAVDDERLAVLYGLGGTVAEFVHAPQCPHAQAQQPFGQFGVVAAKVRGKMLT